MKHLYEDNCIFYELEGSERPLYEGFLSLGIYNNYFDMLQAALYYQDYDRYYYFIYYEVKKITTYKKVKQKAIKTVNYEYTPYKKIFSVEEDKYFHKIRLIDHTNEFNLSEFFRD